MSVFRLKKAPKTAAVPIEALFAELEAPLLAYAYRITSQVEAAQDTVQDAFVKLHQSRVPIHSPRPWLYRTVHNLAINLSKRASRETSLEETESPTQPNETSNSEPLPNQNLEHAEIIELARLFIDQLDERSQAVVRLKFQEGRTYAQIAQELDLTVSNVGYLLHQAVSTLATEFEKLGVRK